MVLRSTHVLVAISAIVIVPVSLSTTLKARERFDTHLNAFRETQSEAKYLWAAVCAQENGEGNLRWSKEYVDCGKVRSGMSEDNITRRALRATIQDLTDDLTDVIEMRLRSIVSIATSNMWQLALYVFVVSLGAAFSINAQRHMYYRSLPLVDEDVRFYGSKMIPTKMYPSETYSIAAMDRMTKSISMR